MVVNTQLLTIPRMLFGVEGHQFGYPNTHSIDFLDLKPIFSVFES